MDAANCRLACGLVSQSYINQGAAALSARRRLIKALLSNKKLPAEGWDEATIEMLLQVSAWLKVCGHDKRISMLGFKEGWMCRGLGWEFVLWGGMYRRGCGSVSHTAADQSAVQQQKAPGGGLGCGNY